MRVLMDGRILSAEPSGVRDIALGMLKGFRQLVQEGELELIVAGTRPRASDHVSDTLLRSKPFMHLALPVAATRLGADRIFVPRQTRPLVSFVPSVPLIHDIGFFRAPALYPKRSPIAVTTQLAARSRRLLSVSQFTSDELVSQRLSEHATSLPIRAIHRVEWSPAPESRYLLCVAAQEPHKNLVRLVEAWSIAETEGFDLVICGRPGNGSRVLSNAIFASSKGESIRVVSGLSDYDYLGLLAQCWGYIQPSLYEGLCIPALDVAAGGTPSVSSALGNLGVVFKNAPVKQVFDPLSVQDMARSIEAVLSDESFRSASSDWNRRHIPQTDWRDVARVALQGMK